MKYKFHSKTSKETISLIEADSLTEAEEKFAEGKKLPLETFRKLFKVKINGDGG
jgi:hypothetical protein